MFDMTQLLAAVQHIFKGKSYGDSLHDYITAHNPKTAADVEVLERQWLYGHMRNTGGQWL